MPNATKFLIAVFVIIIIAIGAIALSQGDTPADSTSPSKSEGKTDNLLAAAADDRIIGDKAAPLTIVEYSDFQCPYCVQIHPTLKQVVEAYPGQVRWVYRYYPLPTHPAAKKAAYAAEAAGNQGKFVEYSDKLSVNSQPDGTGLQSDDLQKYAADLGLDMSRFNDDLASGDTAKRIERDIDSGDALKIRGTPSLFLVDQSGKGEPLDAYTFDELKAVIDNKLSK